LNKFSKSLDATSKLLAPEGRHEASCKTEDQKSVGVAVQNWSLRGPDARHLCAAKYLCCKL